MATKINKTEPVDRQAPVDKNIFYVILSVCLKVETARFSPAGKKPGMVSTLNRCVATGR